jgi:HEAT repeat protein/ketosteroid isomerase-like protein
LLLFALLQGAPAPATGFGPNVVAVIDTALAAQGIEARELGFYKQWAIDSFFRLRIVDRLLDHPLELADSTVSAARQARRADSQPVALLGYQLNRVDVAWSAADSARLWQEVVRAVEPLPDSLRVPVEMRRPVELLLASFAVGRRHLDRAVRGLDARQLDVLVGEAPDFWRESDDTTSRSQSGVLHREFGRSYDTSQHVRAETLLAYARKLDRRELALAGMAVALAASEARGLLQSASPAEFPVLAAPGVEGPVGCWFDTDWGPVVIGAAGENVYRRDCAIVIEVGGDDRYLGRHGGGVGIVGPPFGVVIDLAGNDSYLATRPYSHGAAIFGAGVLIDCGGGDVYRSAGCSQGAGTFGLGLLWDREGDELYDAGCFAQGAGHYGTGLLVDGNGNDAYRSRGYCQGMAGTWGYGLLADQRGNDSYYAGGRVLHEPLLPHEYRSFAQGFAIGVRPDAAGGIGLLCDQSGNDFYNAEVYAQGVSYWYSLGMLWDGDGFDKYSAAQYTQGAGIHLSVGALVDEGGNDMYISRLGPSQGEGHDFSVGLLWDRAGDDGYYCSGGQGVGLTNSVGMLVDEDGNDWYTCVEQEICHGSANMARGFGGVGLFLDLAGRDKYPVGNRASDASRWMKGSYGSGVDLPRPATVVDLEPDVDTAVVEGDSVDIPVDSLFKVASTWEVGNAQKRVKRARKQFNQLGRVAFDYVFDKKADSKDGLESRAIEDLCKAWPDTAKPYLYRALRDRRYLARQNAAYWLGQLKADARDGVDSLLGALAAGRVTPRRAAQSLGEIGDTMVVPRILYLLRDEFEPSRIVTAEACGKLKSGAAVPALLFALADRSFTVRSAAENALVSTGRPGVVPLINSSSRLTAVPLGHALRALGALIPTLDTLADRALRVEVRRTLRSALGHSSPFVRAQAVDGLGRMLDEPLRQELAAAMAEESDGFILGRYRLLLGATE